MKTSHLLLGAGLLLAVGLCLPRRSPPELEKIQAPVGAKVTTLELHGEQSLVTSSPAVSRAAPGAEPEPPSPNDAPEAIRAWLRTIAATHPEQAAAWIESQADEARRMEATRELTQAWAELNPAASLAWAQGLSDAPRREQALEVVCLQVAQQDPGAALTAAIATGPLEEPGGARMSLIENLTAQWANRDVHAALDWARKVPDDTQRGALLNRVAFALAQSEPLAAATLVATEIPGGTAQDQAALTVVYQWALRDPASAATWVSRFPDGPQFGEIVQNLIGVWGEKDAAAAEQWLASLPTGAARGVGEQALREARQRLATPLQQHDNNEE